MPLVRAWTRGLSGASGAALLVPGGIFTALLLLVIAGSFGRLGGLGQAFSGPAAVGSSQTAGGLTSQPAHGAGLLSVVRLPTRAHAGAAGGGLVNPGPAARGGGSRGAGGRGNSGAPGSPGASSRPPACGSCNQPAQPPAPPPTLLEGVVAAGTSITSKLPGPVGQLTTQVLGEVSATIDGPAPTTQRPGVAQAVNQLGSTVSQLKLP